MSESIDISKLDKAEVLCALYNNSRPLGFGFLHYTPEPMTRDEAAKLLVKTQHFDYLKGRVMKIDLSSSMLRVKLYERDNGSGAVAEALRPLLEKR